MSVLNKKSMLYKEFLSYKFKLILKIFKNIKRKIGIFFLKIFLILIKIGLTFCCVLLPQNVSQKICSKINKIMFGIIERRLKKNFKIISFDNNPRKYL